MSAYDRAVAEAVPEGARVLDLGCGEGGLLAALAREKRTRGQGVDISPDAVAGCLEKGVSAVQSDIDGGLPDYPDGAFDVVLLNDTLPEVKGAARVLREAARVGKRVIVAYPNDAHWRARLRFLLLGRAPTTGTSWHAGPGRRSGGVSDFRDLFREAGLRVLSERFLSADGGPVLGLPFLRAAAVVAVLAG